MSEWLNQFENHRIHDDIRSALRPAEAIRSSAEQITPDALERIDRIVYVLSELRRRLDNADPNLIPIQPLNNLQNPLTQISSQLSNYQSNKNAGHIQNAHNQLENVLVHLSQIPIPSTPGDMDSIREAAVALRRSAGQHIRNVEDEGRSAMQQLQRVKLSSEALQSTMDQQLSQTQELLDSLRRKYESEEESRHSHFQAEEQKRKTEAESLLVDKEHQWTEVIKTKEVEYESLYNSIKEKTAALEDEFRNATNAILKNMGDRKLEAEKIVGAITDTGMVGGYQQVANSEKRAAIFWRTVAFLSLCTLVFFAIALFAVTLSKRFEVTTALTLTRSFVGIAVAILAGYAARQSDKHARAQRRYRKMELELASIAPYLHEFPDVEARKIKTELAMKMFAQQETEDPKGSTKTTNSLIDLLKTALESLQSLVGK